MNEFMITGNKTKNKLNGQEPIDMDSLKTTSNNEDIESMKLLGNKYKNGEGCTADPIKSYQWYMKAAKLNDVESMYQIGWLYENIEDIKNLKKSIIWYSKAADHGHIDAPYKLGRIYDSYPFNDTKKSIFYYEMATARGHIDAPYELGKLYENEYETGASIFYYKKAAERGNVDAQYRLGSIYEESFDEKTEQYDYCYDDYASAIAEFIPLMEKSIFYYKKAAEQGNVEAMLSLGRNYRIIDDYCASDQWFEKAAANGSVYPCKELIDTYFDGNFFKYSYENVESKKAPLEKIIKRYQLVSKSVSLSNYDELGDVCVKLGDIYKKLSDYLTSGSNNNPGNTVKELEKLGYDKLYSNPMLWYGNAVIWYEKAAEKGIDHAYYALQQLITHVDNTELSNKAKAILLRAAEEGDSCAQYMIGQYYKTRNIEDIDESILWINKAAENGYAKALLSLGNIYRYGELGTPVDINRALDYYIRASKHRETDTSSSYEIGKIYEEVEEFKDISKSIEWYEKVRGRREDVQQRLERLYMSWVEEAVNDPEEYSWRLERSAKKGYVESMYKLGLYYSKKALNEPISQRVIGYGASSWLKCEYWFGKAAEKGHVEANYRLGMYYKYAMLFNRDDRDRAERYIKFAADKGHVYSQYEYAKICEEELRRSYNISDYTKKSIKSINYYKNAAKGGHIESAFKVISMYEDLVYHCWMHSLSADYVIEYLQWLQYSADNGNVEAIYQMGRIYSYGLYDAPKDVQKGLDLLCKAVEMGCKNAALNLERQSEDVEMIKNGLTDKFRDPEGYLKEREPFLHILDRKKWHEKAVELSDEKYQIRLNLFYRDDEKKREKEILTECLELEKSMIGELVYQLARYNGIKFDLNPSWYDYSDGILERTKILQRFSPELANCYSLRPSSDAPVINHVEWLKRITVWCDNGILYRRLTKLLTDYSRQHQVPSDFSKMIRCFCEGRFDAVAFYSRRLMEKILTDIYSEKSGEFSFPSHINPSEKSDYLYKKNWLSKTQSGYCNILRKLNNKYLHLTSSSIWSPKDVCEIIKDTVILLHYEQDERFLSTSYKRSLFCEIEDCYKALLLEQNKIITDKDLVLYTRRNLVREASLKTDLVALYARNRLEQWIKSLSEIKNMTEDCSKNYLFNQIELLSEKGYISKKKQKQAHEVRMVCDSIIHYNKTNNDLNHEKLIVVLADLTNDADLLQQYKSNVQFLMTYPISSFKEEIQNTEKIIMSRTERSLAVTEDYNSASNTSSEVQKKSEKKKTSFIMKLFSLLNDN